MEDTNTSTPQVLEEMYAIAQREPEDVIHSGITPSEPKSNFENAEERWERRQRWQSLEEWRERPTTIIMNAAPNSF